VRVGTRETAWDRRVAHENIKRTLTAAFNDPATLDEISKKAGFDPKAIRSIDLDFINWGDIQLVYRVDVVLPASTVRLVALISQPKHLLMGRVKEEFENLRRLVENGSTYVNGPLAYFTIDRSNSEELELYVSPYIENARCIYSNRDRHPWGIFDPKPEYHFVPFSENIRFAVTSSLIALLVAHYDAAEGRGLAKTRFSGDDYMLTQGFKHNDPATVLPNLKLIAARGWVETSLDGYLDILRREFMVGTHYDDAEVRQRKFAVNHKCSVPLTAQEIEAGIKLGLSLRP
jgi:hypothetical protein